MVEWKPFRGKGKGRWAKRHPYPLTGGREKREGVQSLPKLSLFDSVCVFKLIEAVEIGARWRLGMELNNYVSVRT
jgi:hypothetical protein